MTIDIVIRILIIFYNFIKFYIDRNICLNIILVHKNERMELSSTMLDKISRRFIIIVYNLEI